MIPKLYCCFLLLSGFTSCAQVNHRFKQSHFFAQPASYGQELRDIDGHPIVREQDTLYFVYLETSKKWEVQITSVQYNGKVFQAAVYPVKEDAVQIGFTEAGEKIVISKEPSHHFIRVELTETFDSPPGPAVPRNELQIKGHLDVRPFRLLLKTKTMLLPEVRG